MTSPQAAALDVAPAIATLAISNPPSANDEVDFTAEAQAQPVEAENPIPQPERPDEASDLLAVQEHTGNAEEGLAEQNGVETQQEEQQQPAETPSGVGDASIPNSDYLQNNQLTQADLDQLAAHLAAQQSDVDIGNTIARMRGGVWGDSVFPSDAMNAMTAQALAMAQQPYTDLDPDPIQERQVEAYAKLEFEDGAYYMNTYSIYLGRDQVAAKKALRQERRMEQYNQDPGQQDVPIGRPVTSNSGGILVPENDPDDEERRSRKARSKKSKASKNSQSSHSSNRKSRRDSLPYEPGVYPIQAQRIGSDTEAVQVDPETLRPDPYGCPLVGIHPQRGYCFQAYKNISRRHVKIAFNSETCVFEIHVLGRNGCFIFENGVVDLKPQGSVHVLHSGTKFQIGEVIVTFVLPGNNTTEGTSSYAYEGSSGLKDTFYFDENGNPKHFDAPVFRDARGKEMNTDHSQEIRRSAGEFTSEGSDDGHDVHEGQANGDIRDDVEEDLEEGEDEEDDDSRIDGEESEEEEEEDEEDDEEDTQDQIPRPSIEEDQSPTANAKGTKTPVVQGKKGPGRPPKNGVMSKRAEKELKKQAEEAAAAEKTGAEGSEAPKKGKVGRPRKHPLPDPETLNKPKRKYTKRKPKENQEGNPEGLASGGDGTTATTKVKKEKPFKPPRSPTPVYREEDLTPEQLVKPSENYVVIIHTAMSQSRHKEMGLPQIYNAIKRAYPYFALRAETKGWESSVRHNLSGNPDVFEKGAKDGKGHMWSLKPGATVDKEKKKKATTEPQYQGQPQVIQQAPHNMHGHQHPGMPYGYPGYPPPYPMGQPPPQFMPHQGPPFPPQQNGFQPPPPNWQPGYGLPPGLPPALGPPAPSHSYSSPYGNGPPVEPNGPQPTNQSQTPSNGAPQTAEQKPQHQGSPPAIPPPQGSPPAVGLHPPQPQFQPQYQNPYRPHIQAPHPQMQYAPTPPPPPPPPPPQHPTPPNQNQVAQQPPPYPSQDQPQTHAEDQPPNQPQVVPQNSSSNPPQIKAENPSQSPIQNQPQPPPIQQLPPPQQAPAVEPSPPSIAAPNPEVGEKIEKMLGEFTRIMREQNVAKEDIINASIALVKRDGDKAVADPESPDYASMKLIIETLRSSLASIEGSGFTVTPPQRSFPPARSASGTQSQPSASVNGNSNATKRSLSSIPRPPFGGPALARPPMHTGMRRTDSGSPATPSSIHRPPSVSGGGPSSVSGSPAPAAALTPVPVHYASVDSPNGASAATSTPVSGPEGMIKTEVHAVSTPVERPADVDVTMNIGENDKDININGQPEQIVGRKRSRDEVDDLAAEGQENVKRIAV